MRHDSDDRYTFSNSLLPAVRKFRNYASLIKRLYHSFNDVATVIFYCITIIKVIFLSILRLSYNYV